MYRGNIHSFSDLPFLLLAVAITTTVLMRLSTRSRQGCQPSEHCGS
ncbi:hypothetical protein KP509_27G019700 [Ceratopteris richardii]|uniref:Uncharacterized protein n=1 Tax=Ceratopteris richardii TaxID=49495 RepID=A0A8T2RFW0_CERRI|nr:hypothetical protein KP509_27G019700 [Ceratopteris richardii]